MIVYSLDCTAIMEEERIPEELQTIYWCDERVIVYGGVLF